MIGIKQSVRISGSARTLQRPVVVELVGPAAVGKTSLLRILGEADRSLCIGIRLPRSGHLLSALRLLPTFIALHQSAPGFLWKEMKRMVFLRTLDQLLAVEATRPHQAIVLDEGPVYMLARMRVYGGEKVTSKAFERWWVGAIERWAETLDLVVWLDAPNTVLIDRIRFRSQRHRTQEFSDAQLHDFLNSYRAAYSRVISALTTPLHLRVLSLCTDQEPLTRVAERVRAELGAGGPHHQ